MSVVARQLAATPRTAPETPCVHCGLPVGPHPVGDDPFFCCTGCQVVHQALHAAGFDEPFYRLRDLTPSRYEARPARTEIDQLRLSEMDTEVFLDEHTRPAGGDDRAIELFLDGVHCAACVWLVERLPFEVEGVTEARLDLPRARLTLQFDPRRTRLSDVARWLARFGYVAHPARTQHLARRTATERRLLIRLGVCWALAANVMLLAFALYAGLDVTNDPSLATAARWASLALAAVSVAYGGSEFFRRAWASLRLAVRARRFHALHMDTPISLGILVGFGHSAWATVAGRGEVWFDSITILIAALLTARWLQVRSRRLAGDATERLLALIPSMARRVRETPDAAHPTQDHTSPATRHASLDTRHSTLDLVRIEDVRPGDLIEVPAGEVFPIDGTVETGASTVNNAVLTGESRPEAVAPGTAVTAGATNLTAPLRVRVTAAGAQTRVGKLLAWIRSQDGRPSAVVLLADRLSGAFVAGVLVLALATAGVWLTLEPSHAAQHVVALLVISCPCALGMATPLAMAVAAGRAARMGIFIKSDEATQQLTSVNTVVLDKTGTLTEGQMTLVDVVGDAASLDLAAALEKHSNHPIATALVQAHGACTIDGRSAAGPTVDALETVAGHGLRGRVDGQRVAVGRPDWIAAQARSWPDTFDAAVTAFTGHGHTPVAVAVDGRPAAVLAFGDRVRDDSRAIIDTLHTAGHTVYLLSGDHPDVVRAVGTTLGFPSDRTHGAVTPEAKQRFVEQLRQEGHTVAMIGDGVNDAAALQAANVGVAVQGGTTPSLVAADIFLTRDGLAPVAALFSGADRVMGVIRRNLGFSLVYNLAGAGAAMLGVVTPLVAAVAMPISSLIVVTLSLTQRSFMPQRLDRTLR